MKAANKTNKANTSSAVDGLAKSSRSIGVKNTKKLTQTPGSGSQKKINLGVLGSMRKITDLTSMGKLNENVEHAVKLEDAQGLIANRSKKIAKFEIEEKDEEHH